MTTHHNGSASTWLVGNLTLSLTACGFADPADTSASGSQARLAPSTQDASIAKSSSTHSAKADAELTAKTFAPGRDTVAGHGRFSNPRESADRKHRRFGRTFHEVITAVFRF